MRAKDEAVFARMEAECSKEKAEEEAYDLGGGGEDPNCSEGSGS